MAISLELLSLPGAGDFLLEKREWGYLFCFFEKKTKIFVRMAEYVCFL